MSELQAALAHRRSINGETEFYVPSSSATVTSQEVGASSTSAPRAGKKGQRRSIAPPPAEVEPDSNDDAQEEAEVAAVAAEASSAPGLDISVLTQEDEDEDEEGRENNIGNASPTQKTDPGQPCAETKTGAYGTEGIDKDKDIVTLTVPDNQPLGVVVAPLNMESCAHTCGGFYVLEIPHPAKNTAGFHVRDVLIGVNGTDLTHLSKESASEFLKEATARTLTVVRKTAKATSLAADAGADGFAPQKTDGKGKGFEGAGEAEKEKENASNRDRRSKRPFPATQEGVLAASSNKEEGNGDKDENDDRNTTTSPWKALRKRLATRKARPLYATGHEVKVDTKRVTRPTMADDLYPVRPGGRGVFGLAADPYVNALENMSRRSRVSAPEVCWPGETG